MPSSARISVQTFNGRISVVAGDDSAVDILVIRRVAGADQATAQAELQRIAVTITATADGASVTVSRPDDATSTGVSGADVELTVPAGSSLDLATSNGAVESADVTGAISVRSSGGAVTIREGTNIDVETSDAAITIVKASGRLTLRTSNGAIDVVDADQAIETGETSDAPMTFSGTLAPGSDTLTTSNGSIELSLSRDAAFTFAGETSNASVSTDLGLAASGGSLSGSVGANPQVHVSAQTSNAPLRVMAPQP